MTKNHIRPLLFGSVTALILTAASPLLAQQPAPLARFTVQTSDIDLSSATGVEKLRKRVDSTIRWACGPVANWTPAEVKAISDCRANAEAAAEPMVRKAVASGSAKLASN